MKLPTTLLELSPRDSGPAGAIALILAIAGAASPARAQCTTQHAQQLSPANPQLNGQFGADITLDGDTLVAGRPNGPDTGAFYAYRKNAGTWTLEAQVPAPSFISGQSFARVVDLDGDALAVGSSTTYRRAFVFRRSGANWSLEATLQPSNFSQAGGFGEDLTIEGEWLVVGADGAATPLDNNTGAVYVFRNVSGTWSQHSILYPPDAQAGDAFGFSVELRGGVLVVGSMRWSSATPLRSAAHIYRFNGTSWALEQVLQPSSPTLGAYYGRRVATSGQVVLVSDIGDSLQSNTGAVYVYRWNGSSWTEEQLLRPRPLTGFPGFCEELAIDGDDAAVTANSSGGRVWHFRRLYGKWLELAEISAASPLNYSGTDLALQAGQMAVGVGTANTGQIASGTAFTFDLGSPSAACTYCTGKTNSQGCVPAITYSGAPSVSQTSGFTIQAGQLIPGNPGVFAYGLTPPATNPFGGGFLCMQSPLFRTPVQIAGGSGTCGGSLSIDFNAWIAGGWDPTLVAGAVVRGQFWSRDTGFAAPANHSFTNAIAFVIAP